MEPDLRCYHHPEREATNQCDRCGDYLCEVCVSIHDDRHLCRTCWAEVAPSKRDARHLRLLSISLYIYAVLVAVGALSEASVRLSQFKLQREFNRFILSRELDTMPIRYVIYFAARLSRSIDADILYSLFLSVGSIIAGWSITRRERWTFCILVAAFCCGSMPFGTALGILTIITLVRPSVRAVFETNELNRLRSDSHSQ